MVVRGGAWCWAYGDCLDGWFGILVLSMLGEIFPEGKLRKYKPNTTYAKCINSANFEKFANPANSTHFQ